MYYSCKEHLDDLIKALEEDGKEKRLLSVIKARYKVMVRHMEITESLIEAARGESSGKLLFYHRAGDKCIKPGLGFTTILLIKHKKEICCK